MFTPIYLLPQYKIEEADKYIERWSHEFTNDVIKIIEEGFGKDALYHLAKANLLDDGNDLKGIQLHGTTFDLSRITRDHFKHTDFSFSSLSHTTIVGASFYGATANFVKLGQCIFKKCVFNYSSFYAAQFDGFVFEECDFLERVSFTNCDFTNVQFKSCYTMDHLFSNCRFDASCRFEMFAPRPKRFIPNESGFDRQPGIMTEIHKSIREGYSAGGARTEARKALVEQEKAFTRHNTKRRLDKAGRYFLEIFTGYGVRPLRVMGLALSLYTGFSIPLVWTQGLREGLLLSAGAFFTFGGHLEKLGAWTAPWFVAESFCGIATMALFVTVLANYWFGER